MSTRHHLLAAAFVLAATLTQASLANTPAKSLEEEVVQALKANPANGEVSLDRDKGLRNATAQEALGDD